MEEFLLSDIEYGERNRFSSVKEYVYNVFEEFKVEGIKELSDVSVLLDFFWDYDELIEF